MTTTTVSPDQRHTRMHPCRLCNGYETMPRGRGERCAGFISEDGEWEHCERVEGVPLDERTTPPTYAHKLYGRCPCGTEHNPARPGAGDAGNGYHYEQPHKRIVATYDYCAADGTLLYQTVRYDPKDFKQRRPDSQGDWIWKLEGVERVLYRLPQVLRSDPSVPIVLVEGEKDADRLTELGWVATTTAQGARSWGKTATTAKAVLRGRQVVIVPDADDAGEAYETDARTDLQGVAASVRTVRLPGLEHRAKDGEDVTDWLDWHGGTPGQLKVLLSQTTAGSAVTAGKGKSGQQREGEAGAEEKQVKRWPKRLDPAAYYGVLGQIVREQEAYIEADSAALLFNLLLVAGVAIGRGAYMDVGAQRHRAISYVVIVGDSGENKGDSWWPIVRVLEHLTDLDQGNGTPLRPERFGGLSTGEGLLHQVRDPRTEWREVKENGKGKRTGEFMEVTVDPGVKDKRRVIFEAEFARVLACMAREGNTLSGVLRDLYDCAEEARSSPKGNPIVATGAHVGMTAHITPEELRRKLADVELFNGFANRFAWVLTHRIKSLDDPPAYTQAAAEQHAQVLAAAIARGRQVQAIKRDGEAAVAWKSVYESLRRGRTGPNGAPLRTRMAVEVCARAHVHVLRWALTFAALDGSATITCQHLDAAGALWDYAEASAIYVFGEVSTDPMAETIYKGLVERGPLTRTEIWGLLGRHTSAEAVQQALDTLVADGRARCEREETAGPPRELWSAVK